MSTGRVPSVLAEEDGRRTDRGRRRVRGRDPVTLTGRRLHRRRQSIWTDAGDVGG